MVDLEGVRIKSTGIDISAEQQNRIARFFLDARKEKDGEVIAKMTPAKLSLKESARLKTSEDLAKKFLMDKMLSHGIPAEEINFPKVNYICRTKDIEDENKEVLRLGFHGGLYIVGVIIDPVRGDLFDASLTTLHELSHATVSKEARIFWKDKQGKPVIEDESIARGLGLTGGSGQELGVGLENGLALCDEVEFCNSYLKRQFASDYQKRVSWVDRIKRRSDYKKIEQSLYEPVPEELLVPFIYPLSPNIPFLRRKIEIPELKGELLKNYLFVRRLCQIIGRSLVESNGNNLADEQLFQAGRNYLDKSRYSRSYEAHRKIVKVFDGKGAKIIFSVDDIGTNIDQAMEIVATKEKELGHFKLSTP